MDKQGPVESGQLITREAEPYNAETPLAVLQQPITPTGAFYVRSHLPIPQLDLRTWLLTVGGLVERPVRLSWADLLDLRPERTITVTLECAGNGRAYVRPPVAGTQWAYGATSTARFTGAPLRSLLDRAGMRPEAVEILFTASDEGDVEPGRRDVYARSLPRAVAMHQDTLLAWTMNGEPLTTEHGFPLRLVVPGWYGMASVKWLARVTAMAGPFHGYYQTERYIYADQAGVPDGTPVTAMRVRAVIAQPGEGEHLPPGPIEIAGTAWSGTGLVSRVDVSLNGGQSWVRAQLQPGDSPYAASTWHTSWKPPNPGAYSVMARATDRAGNVQPFAPLWNTYGYGNNVVQTVHIVVGADSRR